MAASTIALLAWAAIWLLLTCCMLLAWPRKGKMGVNLRAVDCPNCASRMPPVRIPANLHECLWGGWTCCHCGCPMDKYGQARD